MRSTGFIVMFCLCFSAAACAVGMYGVGPGEERLHPELAAWWGPDGFSNTFEMFEFKPQGRWKFVMHGPDGKNYPNDNVFLETSPQKVCIRHVSLPHFTLTVTWAEKDGHTHLKWQQAFDDPGVAASLAHIIVPANEQNLNRLHAVLLAATA